MERHHAALKRIVHVSGRWGSHMADAGASGRPVGVGAAVFGAGITRSKSLGHAKAEQIQVVFHLFVGGGHESCIRSPRRDPREANATRSQGVPGVPASQLRRSGPKAAQAFLSKTNGGVKDRQTWVQNAKVHAILGGMSLFLDSFKSGMRCYFGFVGRYAVCA